MLTNQKQRNAQLAVISLAKPLQLQDAKSVAAASLHSDPALKTFMFGKVSISELLLCTRMPGADAN